LAVPEAVLMLRVMMMMLVVVMMCFWSACRMQASPGLL
jgi:hypothetical protein